MILRALLKKVVFKTFSGLYPSIHRKLQLQHPIFPLPPTQSTETASDEAASAWQTGNRTPPVTEAVRKTTVFCKAYLLLSVKSSRACIRVGGALRPMTQDKFKSLKTWVFHIKIGLKTPENPRKLDTGNFFYSA